MKNFISKEDEDKIMFPQVEVLRIKGKGVRKGVDGKFFEMDGLNGQDLELKLNTDQKFKKLVKDGKGKRIKIVGRKK